MQDVDSLDLENLPSTEASPYKWWAWAHSHPAGITFVALDAKMINLSIDRRVDNRQKHYYCWPKYRHNDGEKINESCEVIMLMIPGRADYIAIMPTHV